MYVVLTKTMLVRETVTKGVPERRVRFRQSAAHAGAVSGVAHERPSFFSGTAHAASRGQSRLASTGLSNCSEKRCATTAVPKLTDQRSGIRGRTVSRAAAREPPAAAHAPSAAL